jgi:hypothetical protein
MRAPGGAIAQRRNANLPAVLIGWTMRRTRPINSVLKRQAAAAFYSMGAVLSDLSANREC